MGLVEPNSFTPTKAALDDSLDRLLRFFGKAAYDPQIRDIKDIGDDQDYFNILLHGAQSAANKFGLKTDLDEFTLLRILYWLEGKLDSKEFVTNLTKLQRDKLRHLITSSKDGILHGLAQEDPIWRSTLFRVSLAILANRERKLGRISAFPV